LPAHGSLGICIGTPAQPAAANADASKTGEHKDTDKDTAPIPPEKSSVTHHELAIGGKSLKYQTSDTYRPKAYDFTTDWDYKHRPTSPTPGGGGGAGAAQPQPYVAADMASAIRKNPHLHVFSANGYFDLATPFFATEYDIPHMYLEPELRGNIQFGYYPSGHMIYLNVDALHQLKDDLAAFIDKAQK
jgi:hypothetical protein